MPAVRMLHIEDGWESGAARLSNTRTWLPRVVSLLEGSGFDVPDPVLVTGVKFSIRDTTAELRKRKLTGPFDVVTVQVGTWDVISDRTAQQLVADIGEILDMAIELAGGDGWHTILVGPNTLVCENEEEVDRMNMIRTAVYSAAFERLDPHVVDVHLRTVQVWEALPEDRAPTYDEISSAHAEMIFHTISHAISERPPEIPDEYGEDRLRSPN